MFTFAMTLNADAHPMVSRKRKPDPKLGRTSRMLRRCSGVLMPSSRVRPTENARWVNCRAQQRGRCMVSWWSKPLSVGAGGWWGKQTKMTRVLLILVVIGFVSLELHSVKASIDNPRADETVSRSSDAQCSVPKANGVLDSRDCDLKELCKDAAFYNRKVSEANAAGDSEASAKQTQSLVQVLKWMGQYRHEDVQWVCGGGARPPALGAVGPMSKPAAVVPATVQCRVAPSEAFRIGMVFDAESLATAVQAQCPGATAQADGNYELPFQGRTFLVELGTEGSKRTVNGVWLK